jgi:hypothetical protein
MATNRSIEPRKVPSVVPRMTPCQVWLGDGDLIPIALGDSTPLWRLSSDLAKNRRIFLTNCRDPVPPLFVSHLPQSEVREIQGWHWNDIWAIPVWNLGGLA